MEEITISSLGFRLDRALWAISTALSTALKEKGINLPHSQYIIMRFLYEQDGISQNRIAAFLHKDAAAIKRSIDILVKKRLAERRVISRSKNGIYLTKQGRQLMPEVIAIANEVFSVMSELPEETCRTGMKYLESIYKLYVEKKNTEKDKPT